MGEFFGDIFTWVESLSPLYAYLVIVGISYGENVVPPVPGDMIIVFGGYLAGVSDLNFFAVWLLATLGGVAGFMTMYAFGARMGDAIYDPNRFRWLPKDYLARVRIWIGKWGIWVVVANRFLSGARSVISLSVGIAHMNVLTTTLASLVSALVWTGVISYAGYAVGENWEVVSVYLRGYGVFILAGTALVAMVLFARMRVKKRREARVQSGEMASHTEIQKNETRTEGKR